MEVSAQIHASAALPPEEGLPVLTRFLLRIFFYPEDEDDIFLRNIGLFSTEYIHGIISQKVELFKTDKC
jgi:hypothetical protein